MNWPRIGTEDTHTEWCGDGYLGHEVGKLALRRLSGKIYYKQMTIVQISCFKR